MKYILSKGRILKLERVQTVFVLSLLGRQISIVRPNKIFLLKCTMVSQTMHFGKFQHSPEQKAKPVQAPSLKVNVCCWNVEDLNSMFASQKGSSKNGLTNPQLLWVRVIIVLLVFCHMISLYS